MILYEKDWERYPNAIVHNDTKNESFKRLAYVYKTRGIKNHLFLLALHDPSIKDLDPHSEDLTMVERLKIAKETRYNYWYYLREIVKLDVSGEMEPINITANRGIIAHAWCFWNYVNTMVILIRQQGKSLMHSLLYTHVLELSGFNSGIGLLTKDSVLKDGEVERIKSILSNLPSYIKTSKPKDKRNLDVIENTNLQNRMKIYLAQKSKIAALNVGRGDTITIHGIDEIAYDYNVSISLPAMLAAGTTAKKNAKKKGAPAGTCLYTTTGYLDTDSGKFTHSLISKSLRWSDDFYDLPDRDALLTILKKQCTGNMDLMVIEFNHRELGMTDEELRQAIRDAGASGVKAEVEFLNIWANGSSESLLDRDLIRLLNESEIMPLSTEISVNGFVIRWYVDPDEYKDKPFVIGLDSSEMLGNDSSALVGIDPITGEVIMAGDYNVSKIDEFGEFIFWLLLNYEKAVMIGERKSTVMAIFDQVHTLAKTVGMNIYERLYNDIVDEGLIYSPDRKMISEDELYNIERKKFGFVTAGNGKYSRDNLYNKLHTAVSLIGNKMRDKSLVKQIVKLEKKNGKVVHKYNEHDDLVIAMLLVYWFLTNAKNIKYYGLDSNIILSLVDSGIKTDDTMERERLEREVKIKEEIGDLLTDMENEPNPFIRSRYLASIRRLKRMLGKEVTSTLNLEARLKAIAEKYNKKT